MKRVLFATLLGLALAAPAAAQTVNAGKYDVEGTNLDGSAYSGTAEITLASDTTCVIEWDTNGTKSTGVCMLNGNAFAAAYVLGDALGLVGLQGERRRYARRRMDDHRQGRRRHGNADGTIITAAASSFFYDEIPGVGATGNRAATPVY